LGNIDPKKNDEYSQVLFDFLLARLGIPGDRGYMCDFSCEQSIQLIRKPFVAECSTILPTHTWGKLSARDFPVLAAADDLFRCRHAGTTFGTIFGTK
jgi:hypothetical protein